MKLMTKEMFLELCATAYDQSVDVRGVVVCPVSQGGRASIIVGGALHHSDLKSMRVELKAIQKGMQEKTIESNMAPLFDKILKGMAGEENIEGSSEIAELVKSIRDEESAKMSEEKQSSFFDQNISANFGVGDDGKLHNKVFELPSEKSSTNE